MFMLWKDGWVLSEKCLGRKFKKRTGMNNKNGERCEHKRQGRQEMQYQSNWMEGTAAPLAVTKLFRGRGQIEQKEQNLSTKRSSLIYNTSARHERHECGTNATWGRHEWDTSAT